MMTMTKLNDRELENVNGGTTIESTVLAIELSTYGYGIFMDYPNGIDFEGLRSFFASKGFTFIPSQDGQNLFQDCDGITYCQDYIEYLIESKSL